ANGGGYVPVPGDLAVWGSNCGGSGIAGHVAVVDSVDAGHVYVCEQNYSVGGHGRATINRSGTNGSSLARADGWGCIRGVVHSPNNNPTPPPPPPTYLYQIQFTGDFNGDGKTDIAWRRKGWPSWTINPGGGGAAYTLSDGHTDFIPGDGLQAQVAGDFDGDGKTDIAWRRTGWVNWI